MSRQYQARRCCVAAGIACSNTSSSESLVFIMEHFTFFKWLFTNPSSYFLKTFSSLSHVRLFSACVWGSMGAEKGNYTASDLGMTVGFGLGLRVGSRMTETREVSLVYECSVYCDRPPNGDQTLQSRSEPSQLATPSTCPTAQPPRVSNLPHQ